MPASLARQNEYSAAGLFFQCHELHVKGLFRRVPMNSHPQAARCAECSPLPMPAAAQEYLITNGDCSAGITDATVFGIAGIVDNFVFIAGMAARACY